MEQEHVQIQIKIAKVVNTDSYEIDWATERREPMNVYLELDLQPASKFAKTIAEPINKKDKRDREFVNKQE